MYISAKVDYATRVLLELAAEAPGAHLKGAALAERQGLPARFVENTLSELRRAGIVASQRGAEGGYRLARPPHEIRLAEIFRALEGPLAEVQGVRPDQRSYEGPAAHLRDVWVAVRAALRSVLETTTLADVAGGTLPDRVAALVADPDAWVSRPLGPGSRNAGG